jgi:acetyl esterase/lipase
MRFHLPLACRALILAMGSLLMGLAATASTPVATSPIDIPSEELLAQFPQMTGFQLSPDGKHMLAIESQGDTRNILVWKLENLSAKPTVIGASAMQIRRASFLKNDVLQVELMQPYDLRTDVVTKTFINKLLFTDLEGKVWKEPMASAEIARSDEAKLRQALANPSVLSRMPRDPDHIVVESDSKGDSRDVYRYNVRTGTSQRLMRLGETDGQVWVDGAGQVWAKARYATEDKGAYIAIDFRNKAGEWEEHFRSYVKDRDVVDVVRRGVKPGTAIIRSNVGREFAGLYEYDIAERKIVSTVFEHKYFDADGVRVVHPNDELSEAGFDGYTYKGFLGNDVHWVNAKIESVVRGLAQALNITESDQQLVNVVNGESATVRAFNGADVQLRGYLPGEVPTYLVRVSGLTYPTEHYLLRGQKLMLLAREFPKLDKRALGTAKFVYYKARDGLNIPAYLTLPSKDLCGPGPYAAVIHPHGGPWARDTMDFDYSGWVPLMVSRCQAVLQPQYRGSADWGRSLWVAGDAEWGQKMQDDKDDGAKWLVSEKLADPKRIAMFGFSYGGYAAFAASVRPMGIYKCAIAGAGVSDIERIWARFYTNPFFRQRQAPTVKGLSPANKADQIEIPILVYTGDRDQTVPEIQSELFVNRARAAKKPVEYYLLKDYAHGPAWTRATNTQQLKLISGYFKNGCGGGGL